MQAGPALSRCVGFISYRLLEQAFGLPVPIWHRKLDVVMLQCAPAAGISAADN
jgi:hypothetical protein